VALHGSKIAIIELASVVVIAALVIKWIQRQLLLAWLGVKSTANLPHTPLERMLLRFQKMPTSIWMFAWFKVRLDPMFRELPGLLETMPEPKTILDIGCGYGMAGRALLEWFPGATLFGIDPSRARVRFASKIFAERGRAIRARAPELPLAQVPDPVEAVFILDVIHYLNDAELELTLQQIRKLLADGRWLVIRVSIPEAPTKSLFFRLEVIERALTRGHAYYRTAAQVEQALRAAGFDLRCHQMSGTDGELCWFIATAESCLQDEPGRPRPESESIECRIPSGGGPPGSACC
jgi:SAM-dependent methyltransferase